MRFGNRKENKVMLISGNQPHFDGNTFSVRTEPGVQASKLPEPIPLVGRECKYVDAKYVGDPNLADNTVPVAAMDQTGSEWRKIDNMTMKLRFNYLGLGMKPSDHNAAYNKQFRITQEQAISAAYASQLTELEFMAEKICSDIPEMRGLIDQEEDTSAEDNQWTGSGQFAYLVFYAAFLQNMSVVMGKYNTQKCFGDYMLDMGYNAESALTLRFLNMMKKQNVWTVFDQLGNILTSQFFDLDFYNEITAINAIPCRKYDEVGSPLITITSSINMPHLAVFRSDADQLACFDFAEENSDLLLAMLKSDNWSTPIIFTFDPWDSEDTWADYFESTWPKATSVGEGKPFATNDDWDAAKARCQILDDKRDRYRAYEYDDEGEVVNTYSLQELVEEIADLLSPYEILKWARTRYFSQDLPIDLDPAKTRINRIIMLVGRLVDITSHFRSDTVDLVTFLRVLQNSTSMNTWVLDTPYLHPSVKVQQLKPVYFKLIYDLLTSYGTSGQIRMDDNTRGWDIFTWWHTTEGVPKYDVYDGGFTIASSIRGIPANDSDDYTTPEYMIPKLFDVVEDSIYMLSRQGKERQLTSSTVSDSDIKASPIFAACQLMELPSSIQIPVLSFAGETDDNNELKRDYSQAIRCLTSMFGIGKIITADSTEIEFMDKDMEGLIGRTFSNGNTMALNYINSHAPFRTTTPAGPSLGFMVG